MDIRYTNKIASFTGSLRRFDLNHVEFHAGCLGIQPDERDAEHLRVVIEEFDASYTIHGPHLDVVLRSVNGRLRNAAAAVAKGVIELAMVIDADGVIAHGGPIRARYPGHVREHAHK